MKKSNLSSRVIASLFLTVALNVNLIACGGGTSGTDGGTRFVGRVLTTDSEPIAGATLTLVETGESALANSDGEFEIDSSLSEDTTANLLVERDTVRAIANLGDIPANTEEVSVTVFVDTAQNQAEASDITVTPRSTGSNGPRGGSSSSSSSSGQSSSSSSSSSALRHTFKMESLYMPINFILSSRLLQSAQFIIRGIDGSPYSAQFEKPSVEANYIATVSASPTDVVTSDGEVLFEVVTTAGTQRGKFSGFAGLRRSVTLSARLHFYGQDTNASKDPVLEKGLLTSRTAIPGVTFSLLGGIEVPTNGPVFEPLQPGALIPSTTSLRVDIRQLVFDPPIDVQTLKILSGGNAGASATFTSTAVEGFPGAISSSATLSFPITEETVDLEVVTSKGRFFVTGTGFRAGHQALTFRGQLYMQLNLLRLGLTHSPDPRMPRATIKTQYLGE